MSAEKKHQYFFMLGQVVLLLGLLCSKALISIGSVFIIGSAVWQIVLNPGLISSPPKPVLGFLLLFFVPFLSFFWSENMHDWQEVVLNKVMLPALAWSYWLAPKLDKREYFWLSVTNIGLVLAGTVYSIGHYLFSADYVNESYLRAKTLKVMYLDDHLHFSLWIIITLGLMLYDWQVLISYWRKYSKFVFGAIALWLILFLHVLGAKTGLILLYAGLFYLFFQKGIGKISSFYKIMILPLTLGLLFLSYIFIPTFKNRLHYTLYDFNQYAQGSFINGLTDGARVLSWKAGTEIAHTHPILGVGFGDLHDVFDDWHETHSAHLETYNWLQPSNEWLMYWCGSGWLGMILLSIGLWWIYRYSGMKDDRVFAYLFLAQVLMMWYEVNLSNQMGITLFVFSWGWLQLGNRAKLFESDNIGESMPRIG